MTGPDMVEGRTYFAPSGRLCKLLPKTVSMRMDFAYLSRREQRQIEDGFSLMSTNAVTLGAFRAADIVPRFVGVGV